MFIQLVNTKFLKKFFTYLLLIFQQFFSLTNTYLSILSTENETFISVVLSLQKINQRFINLNVIRTIASFLKLNNIVLVIDKKKIFKDTVSNVSDL